MDHPHSLAHAPRLGELHVDAVGVRGGRRDVREILAALVDYDRQAWLELERSYAHSAAPVELVELQVLEDLVVELIFDGRHD